MVFVKRDSKNVIVGLFANKSADEKESLEEIQNDHQDVIDFLARCTLDKTASFLKSDIELIRVIEDLIQILMTKNYISITDFPLPVIEKLVARQKIRTQFENVSKLFDDE